MINERFRNFGARNDRLWLHEIGQHVQEPNRIGVFLPWYRGSGNTSHRRFMYSRKPDPMTAGSVPGFNSWQTKSMAGFMAFRNESRSSTGGAEAKYYADLITFIHQPFLESSREQLSFSWGSKFWGSPVKAFFPYFFIAGHPRLPGTGRPSGPELVQEEISLVDLDT
jgi:hypothetical protein